MAAEARSQPGNRTSEALQAPVGDDARIVPGTLRRRNVPGRAMALPYKPWQTLRPKGLAVTTRAAVGRDALIPPDPTAARTSRF